MKKGHMSCFKVQGDIIVQRRVDCTTAQPQRDGDWNQKPEIQTKRIGQQGKSGEQCGKCNCPSCTQMLVQPHGAKRRDNCTGTCSEAEETRICDRNPKRKVHYWPGGTKKAVWKPQTYESQICKEKKNCHIQRL